MTDNVDFSRSFRRAAWALARVCCVGLLFLGTTNCLPAPSDDSGNGGTTYSAGGEMGSGGMMASGGFPAGGSTHVSSGGATYTSNGGATYTSNGGATYTANGGATTTANGGATTTANGGATTTANGGATTTTTTTSTPTAGTTSVTPTGGAVATTCTPVPKSTGGIACPAKKCTVGTYSGYSFSYGDGKTSSVCLAAESLCAAGVTGAQDPPAYSVYGAGIGFNLSPLTTATTPVPVQLTGTGVTVTVSSLPTGAELRVQVNVGATAYCAKMTTATQTIPWTSFNSACWAPTTAGALAGAPNTPNIQFQASSGTAAGSFDFCVTALSFQ